MRPCLCKAPARSSNLCGSDHRLVHARKNPGLEVLGKETRDRSLRVDEPQDIVCWARSGHRHPWDRPFLSKSPGALRMMDARNPAATSPTRLAYSKGGTILRHVVIFSWKPDVSTEAIDAVKEALARVGERLPEIQDLSFGEDLGFVSGKFGAELGIQSRNGDFALVMDFADLDAWQRYNEHPEHRALVMDHLGHLIDDRISVQFARDA